MDVKNDSPNRLADAFSKFSQRNRGTSCHGLLEAHSLVSLFVLKMWLQKHGRP